ncbi:MAG: radical SAM protein [Clostridia bacterium]|nr:radical SAM protein [Clostridia bacterium]
MKKGLISGIKRMEIHDGDGFRTTVFFKGCPLRCLWCHNPESISNRIETAYFRSKCVNCRSCRGERTPDAASLCPTGALHVYGTEYGAEELALLLLRDRAFFGEKGGVTFSGGECLFQPEFAAELAERLSEEKVGVYIDTCGFVKREAFEMILPFAERFLFDVKAIDGKVHEKCTGQKNALILANLEFLVSSGAPVEIRYPLVKGFNDLECEKIGAYLKALGGIEKIKVLRYHSLARSRYAALGLPDTMPETETSPEDVKKAVGILKGFGLDALEG